MISGHQLVYVKDHNKSSHNDSQMKPQIRTIKDDSCCNIQTFKNILGSGKVLGTVKANQVIIKSILLLAMKNSQLTAFLFKYLAVTQR